MRYGTFYEIDTVNDTRDGLITRYASNYGQLLAICEEFAGWVHAAHKVTRSRSHTFRTPVAIPK